MSAELQRILLWAFIATWATVIPALSGLVWWFIRRDRSSVISKLGDHERRIVDLRTETDDLNTAVFGHDGSSGVNKYEHKVRNMLAPMELRIGEMSDRFTRLTLVIARAIPTIDLKDLLP